MKIIFLDIDGVLNNCKPLKNGYCAFTPECVEIFNKFLLENPNINIVLSSSWRYMILKGAMSLKGFEYLLITHGFEYMAINDKIIGVTCLDEEIATREGQILDYVGKHPEITQWAVIDDMDLEIEKKVKTDRNTGITNIDILILKYIMEIN